LAFPRDYAQLLDADKRISRALEKLRAEFERAEAAFAEKDDVFVAELVPLRRELTELEPATDSAAKRPAHDHDDRDAKRGRGTGDAGKPASSTAGRPFGS
jgi:hypothetical protein